MFHYLVEVDADNEQEAYELALSELQDGMDAGHLDDVRDMANTEDRTQ